MKVQRSTFARTSSVMICLPLSGFISVRKIPTADFFSYTPSKPTRTFLSASLRNGGFKNPYSTILGRDNDISFVNYFCSSKLQSLNHTCRTVLHGDSYFLCQWQCLNYSHLYCILQVPTSPTSASWLKEQTGINDGSILILDTGKWDPSLNAFNVSCQAAAVVWCGPTRPYMWSAWKELICLSDYCQVLLSFIITIIIDFSPQELVPSNEIGLWYRLVFKLFQVLG